MLRWVIIALFSLMNSHNCLFGDIESLYEGAIVKTFQLEELTENKSLEKRVYTSSSGSRNEVISAPRMVVRFDVRDAEGLLHFTANLLVNPLLHASSESDSVILATMTLIRLDGQDIYLPGIKEAGESE